jgi:lipid-A-disaccharide synthase
MKYYIIAGEASGDMHGANLMKELKRQNVNAVFRCWGGDRMQKAGGEIVKHYRELAFMGFTEVIINLRTILRNIDFCKKDIRQWKPDAIILIDYPGFNLRIAEFAYGQKLKVIYYISPQVWAWKQSRVQKIKKFVGLMMVILPFEKEFYKKFNYTVEYVGHPLLDEINETLNTSASAEWRKKNGLTDNPIIALLPGSRMQEINKMLTVMLSVVSKFPQYQFAVSAAPSADKVTIEKICSGFPVKIIYNDSYSLLQNSFAALVTSGTATLETALFGVPQVVCYKGGTISFLIARQLVNVKFISLVNLIMEREVVRELIQNQLTEKNLAGELEKILSEDNRRKMLEQYGELRTRLGGSGASQRAAQKILEFLAERK